MRTKIIRGGDVKPGDTMVVWWAPHRDNVTGCRPYRGPLAHLWPTGARIIEFGIGKSGMTHGNAEDAEIVARARGEAE